MTSVRTAERGNSYVSHLYLTHCQLFSFYGLSVLKNIHFSFRRTFLLFLNCPKTVLISECGVYTACTSYWLNILVLRPTRNMTNAVSWQLTVISCLFWDVYYLTIHWHGYLLCKFIFLVQAGEIVSLEKASIVVVVMWCVFSSHNQFCPSVGVGPVSGFF